VAAGESANIVVYIREGGATVSNIKDEPFAKMGIIRLIKHV